MFLNETNGSLFLRWFIYIFIKIETSNFLVYKINKKIVFKNTFIKLNS